MLSLYTKEGERVQKSACGICVLGVEPYKWKMLQLLQLFSFNVQVCF